jgi:hypothetical protein
MRRLPPSSHLFRAGSTLVEAMVACGIVSLFFAGLFDMNWRGLYMLKSAADGASASQVLANLAEQIRTANWTEITDPTYISGTILTNSAALGHLPNATQTIDVYPYPAPASPSAMQIEAVRNTSGTVSTTLSGNGQLSAQTAVRVDLTLTWSTAINRNPHTRMLSLIVSQSGVLGLN